MTRNEETALSPSLASRAGHTTCLRSCEVEEMFERQSKKRKIENNQIKRGFLMESSITSLK